MVLSLTGWWISERHAPRPAGSADVVAVMPFSYRGAGELEYLGEGMVTLLSSSLDGAGPLRAVETRELLSEWSGGGSLDLETARGVARRLGAGMFVVGEVIAMEDRVRVRARVHPTEGDDPPVELEADGAVSGMFDVVDRLATALLEGRADPGLTRVAARTTESIEALKRFLSGEAAYRAGRHREAMDDLLRAVEIDSTFALAHYRLSTAAIWNDRDEIARESASRAVEHSGRLSVEDSLLVGAWFHHRNGRVEEAESMYRRVLELEPGSVEAWFQLGELSFHWGPMTGRPIAEAREPFERVIEIDSLHASALLHLVRIAALERREPDLTRWTSRLETLNPEPRWVLEARTLRDLVLGPGDRKRTAMRRVDATSPAALDPVVNAVAVYVQDLDAAIELAREMTSSGRSERERIRGRLRWAELEAARGRRRAARSVLDAAGALPGPRVLEYRARLAGLPFFGAPAEEARALRRALGDSALTPPLPPADHPMWHGAAEYPPLSWAGIHAPRRHYLRGVLAARSGNDEELEDAIRALERLEWPLAPYYAVLLGAIGAAEADEAGEVLRRLGPPRPWTTFETATDDPRARERWLRAEALAGLERWEEAVRWYATFPSPVGNDLAYLAPARLGEARARAALGDREGARRAYDRFLTLWREADEELQPVVERGRAERERLRTR